MLPPIPALPTDSLHRFLAITGFLMFMVPIFYLSGKIEEIEINSIHLKAERRILRVKSDRLDKDVLLMKMMVYGPDIESLTPIQKIERVDSLKKLHKLANISVNSANVELKKLAETATQQSILTIRLSEKDDIIKQNISTLKIYTSISTGFAITGFLMWVAGTALWFIKEYTDHKFTLVSSRKKPDNIPVE